MVATGLAAAVAIALAIVLATRSTSSTTTGASGVDSAQSTARFACAMLDQIPEAGFDLKSEPVLLDKIGVIAELAVLVRDQDPSLRALAHKLQGPQQAIAVEFKATGPQFQAALAAARAACAKAG